MKGCLRRREYDRLTYVGDGGVKAKEKPRAVSQAAA